MATRKLFEQQLESRLNEWDARIRLWSAKARRADSNARLEFDNELDGLRLQRKHAAQALDRLRERGEGAWQDLQAGAEAIWGQLETSVERAAARFD